MKNKRFLASVILYIILIYWVTCGCLSVLGIHLFTNKQMVDDFYVDGDDLSPFVNLGIFVVGGAVSLFAMFGMYIITALGSLILTLICRFGLLKKTETQGKDIRKVMSAIIIFTVIAYITACIITKLSSTFFMFITLAWIPLLYFLIVYLPLKDNNTDIVEIIEPDNKFENHE